MYATLQLHKAYLVSSQLYLLQSVLDEDVVPFAYTMHARTYGREDKSKFYCTLVIKSHMFVTEYAGQNALKPLGHCKWKDSYNCNSTFLNNKIIYFSIVFNGFLNLGLFSLILLLSRLSITMA